MTLPAFMNKYPVGTKIDFDGAFGAQCVDLFRQYNKEVFGFAHTGAVNGAKDLYLNYENLPTEKALYKRIKTTSPRTGDVVIWDGSRTNIYGHVAICIGDDLYMEQDGLKQNGVQYAYRSSANMLGVLRKR